MSVYAVSDLHGQLELYFKIKDFLKPEDYVYCLGDCGDRGPKSWETIEAVASDKQFKYLKGNHEDMLVAAIGDYLHEPVKTSMEYDLPVDLLCYNGGAKTLRGWGKSEHRLEWLKYLESLSTKCEYANSSGIKIILTHAGPISALNNTASDFDLLWNRDFDIPWPENFDNTMMIHGHTPCRSINPYWRVEDKAIWYANAHKVNIDMGAFMTKACLLIDLDTFDEHLFKIDNK